MSSSDSGSAPSLDLEPETGPDSGPETGIRARVRRLVEHQTFQKSIMALIVVNAITLGAETSPTVMGLVGPQLLIFDQIVIVIFCIELVLRIYAHGLPFFRGAWNIFDFIVVAITLAPSNDSLAVLRSLRILRVLRLVSAVPRLRRIVAALLHAVPGVGAIAALLLLVFYVYAVISTKLFGAAFPDWFGSIGDSMYTLFQIMTLESWSMGIVRPVMDEFPMAWAFFVPFIVVTAFSVLNLFIGLLVNTMQSAVEADAEAEFEKLRELVRSETDIVDAHVVELQQEIRELRKELTAARGGGND